MDAGGNTQQTWRGVLVLLRAERLMPGVICGVGIAGLALTLALGRMVSWPPFLAGYAATLGRMMIAAHMRGTKDCPRLAGRILRG